MKNRLQAYIFLFPIYFYGNACLYSIIRIASAEVYFYVSFGVCGIYVAMHTRTTFRLFLIWIFVFLLT